MSKEKFRDVAFKPDSLEQVERMASIVEEYERQDLRLTARQLYYQLVARGFIPNTERSYKNTTNLLTRARYAGLVDWDAIEDRGRVVDVPSEWSSLGSLVRGALAGFRLPRWEGQEHYVELWVEKQALAGVLEPLASEYHVPLMVNKGYSSASAMYAAAQRFLSENRDAGCVIFYLGDHDPSGEDMVRDIGTRLREFGVEDLRVEKLALTMEQVRQYDPPPNPAKTTDSRYAGYAAEHGDESWEVDALPPDVLVQIIRRAIDGVLDREMMDAVIAREEDGKRRLRRAAGDL